MAAPRAGGGSLALSPYCLRAPLCPFWHLAPPAAGGTYCLDCVPSGGGPLGPRRHDSSGCQQPPPLLPSRVPTGGGEAPPLPLLPWPVLLTTAVGISHTVERTVLGWLGAGGGERGCVCMPLGGGTDGPRASSVVDRRSRTRGGAASGWDGRSTRRGRRAACFLPTPSSPALASASAPLKQPRIRSHRYHR